MGQASWPVAPASQLVMWGRLSALNALVNLGVQEGRLRRQAEKDLTALQALQQPRLQATQACLNEAARLYINAVHTNRQEGYDPEALGFEFTVEEIEARAIELGPDLFHEWACEQRNR